MEDQLRQKKIDPSANKQFFPEIHLKLHCCRYWICTQWECTNMAFPFWRIYHNVTHGARILYNDIETELTNDKIVVIPPNTPYSNYLVTKEGQIKTESIEGGTIRNREDLCRCRVGESFDHLFIHFNLGMPFDNVKPGVYSIKKTDMHQTLLENIKSTCMMGEDRFQFRSGMDIHKLALELLSEMPEDLWMNEDMDKRIQTAQQYIQNNFQADLSNGALASQAYMATNSFTRLFRENTGESVQQFVMKSRIENARLLMHHSDKNIDTIAGECGFCSRHHFSRAFKQLVGMSPAYYRQHVTLK